ncbi:MAG: VWA domain-containing protein [Thermonemataceae bacterium]|nr:VWA domain-containing protein [Thermonemataceae bacterium]
MLGYRFQKYRITEENTNKANFQSLLKIFLDLINITGGNVAETLAWLNNLDKKYQLTDDSYGMGDFIDDLKKEGYLEENPNPKNPLVITPKSERTIRKNALEEIFGKLKKTKAGNHSTRKSGQGDEIGAERKRFNFGDDLDKIAFTESLRNAQINHGFENFTITPEDLEILESEHKAQTSTVLMIDISHSMILYGEDRITPAKKVAMGLAELITTRYPKDTLDIIVFGNDAWQIQIKDLPYLQVGPYHTNTVAGLELAMDLLRRRKNTNKQIFMITDGKPTCLKEGIRYYKNSFGLDRKILNKTLNLASQCRKLKIPITTFMIATDPYLQEFVREFTQANQGRAYYSSLNGLGNYLFEDYQKNRKKHL